jgi:hypothetical protein
MKAHPSMMTPELAQQLATKCIRCKRELGFVAQQLCEPCAHELQAAMQASMRTRFANEILDNAARLAAAKAMAGGAAR